jgi:hypothetical protein
MFTVKSPRRCTNSLVPSSGSTIRKVLAVSAWLAACSSVMSVTSGNAARSPAEISASAASSASVTGLASDLAFTAKSGPL